MRRRALAATAIGMGLLTPGASLADGGPARDKAVGAGENEFALGVLGTAGFTLSAHSGPAGEDPSGYITAKGDPDGPGPAAPFTAQGPVTCLRVVGNRASVRWRFERATGSAAPFEGGGVQSFVEDNGPPRFGQPVDRAAIDPPVPAAVFEAQAEQCDLPDRPTKATLNRGNITVDDAAGG